MALSAVESWRLSLDWASFGFGLKGKGADQVPSIHDPLSNPPDTRKNLQLRGWRVTKRSEGERGEKG